MNYVIGRAATKTSNSICLLLPTAARSRNRKMIIIVIWASNSIQLMADQIDDVDDYYSYYDEDRVVASIIFARIRRKVFKVTV